KGHKTMILCTHYMEEADSLCDRVAILNKGRIIDVGTPAYLKSKIHGDVILKVKIQKPIDPGIFRNRILQFSSVGGVDFVDGEFLISLKHRNEISEIVDLFNNEIISINTKEPTLEDVFINTVN
ncbi:MAG TPA: ABC transporter ATP-binding protein, partial [Methanobacterium sp.]